MSAPEFVLLAVVLFIGVPAIRWNVTSAALVVAWAFGYVLFWVFDYRMSTPEMVYCDWAVIAIIMAKPEACNHRPYRGLWHQLRCMFLERSVWDRAVMALFALAWLAYAAPISAFDRWWSLFFIAVLQFLAAAGEAFTKWRCPVRRRNVQDSPPAGLEFAGPAWGGGYG